MTSSCKIAKHMHDFCLLLLKVTLTEINCAVPLVESTHYHENFCEKIAI